MLFSKEKRFFLVFPKGRVVLGGGGGGKNLASKLRGIWCYSYAQAYEDPKVVVQRWVESGRGASPKGDSYAEVVNIGKREMGDAIWFHSVAKEVLKSLKLLKKCLVGRWGDFSD